MIRRDAHRRGRAAAAVAAYPRSRPERDAVRAGHRAWTASTAFGEPLAIEAYQSALEGEERAADTYARPMRPVRHLTETSPAHQTAFDAGAPGGVGSADDDRRATTAAEARDGRRFEPADGVRPLGRREPRSVASWDVQTHNPLKLHSHWIANTA